MDKKDQKIIEVLQENSRSSTQAIAKKTLIPITTVHNRIKKLKQSGIIDKFTISLNYKKIGKSLAAYIQITVDYSELKRIKKTQHELAAQLKNHKDVEQVAMLTGGSDIIIKIRVSDIDALDTFVTKDIRNIDGIEKTQTAIILNEL